VTPASVFWTPARIAEWQQWAVKLLETMPAERAAVAYAELMMLPAEQWGTVTRVLARLAALLADGVHGAPWGGSGRTGCQKAVCSVLEAHPDAVVRSAWDCENCGFMVLAIRGGRSLTSAHCAMAR
jgi:hypothetical protein